MSTDPLITFSLFVNLSEENIVLNLSPDAIILTIKYILQLLNLTKWEFSPFDIDVEKTYHLGYIILSIGRIFIGYGYFQVVQAFRKYGKN